jgi:hypothetical protein
VERTYKVVQTVTRVVTTEVVAKSAKNAKRKFWWGQSTSEPKIENKRSLEVLDDEFEKHWRC